MAIQIQGDKQIELSLRELGRGGAKRAVRSALRAGGRIIANAMKSNIPVTARGWNGAQGDGGQARRSIRVKPMRDRGEVIAVKVGPDARKFKGSAFYLPWVEDGHFAGTRVRVKKVAGQNTEQAYRDKSVAAGRKWIEGKHYIQQAYDASKDAAASAIETKLADNLAKLNLADKQ